MIQASDEEEEEAAMVEVLLFHHIRGRTEGMEALAERLRAEGTTVHLPDLFERHVFDTREEGRAYVDEIGFDTIGERGRLVAQELPPGLVYAGVSLGVVPAQLLTQTRPGARGLLAVSAAIEPRALGAPWPDGVGVQIHAMAEDPLFAEEDLEAARGVVETVPGAELFLYPGSGHLFTDVGDAAYDAGATDLVLERARTFLADR